MITPTPAHIVKRYIWLKHVESYEDRFKLNKIHNNIIDLFKATTADEVQEDSRTKIFDTIMALKVNSLLLEYSMEDEMMITVSRRSKGQK